MAKKLLATFPCLTKLIVSLIVLFSFFFLLIFKDLGVFLIRDDKPEPGIRHAILLMGNVSGRTPGAYQALKEGTINEVVYFQTEPHPLETVGLRDNDGKLTDRYLKSLGADQEAIVYLSDTKHSSTFEEAEAFLKYASSRSPPPDRVAVITSWYHSSRAGYIFDKVFKDSNIRVAVIPVIPEGQDPKHWWRQEKSFLMVFNEYLKWVYYLIHY